MPWVWTNGRRYYRRSYRAGGRVVTEYVGGFLAGAAAAVADTTARSRRTEHAAQAKDVVAAARAVLAADRLLAGVFAAAAIGRGLHLHRRQWRPDRRSAVTASPPDPPAGSQALEFACAPGRPPLQQIPLTAVAPEDRAALQAAARGEPTALARVRKYLEDPAWAARWGNPAQAAMVHLMIAVAGNDLLVARAVVTACEEMKAVLGWESAGLAGQLAITRVLHNWLTVAVLEARASDLPPEGRARVQVEKCLTQADRRLQMALRTLAVVQRVRPADLMARVLSAGAGVGLGGLRPPRNGRVEEARELGP